MVASGMGVGVGDDTLYIGVRTPSARTSPRWCSHHVREDGLT